MNNNNMTAIDLINILSFVIDLKNLNMNISQTDLQHETNRLDAKVDEKVQAALKEIHKHLEKQDQKLNYIINILNKEEKGNE